jgi:TonB family protein
MDKKPWRRQVPLLIGLVLAAVVALVIWQVKAKFDQSGRQKKSVQQVVMFQPPPPPPPPPPPEVKPPEPEKVEEIKQPEPEKVEEPPPEAPPSGPLGLDAEGGAGNDGFGLVGNKGGKEFGTIGGNAGSVLAWYGGKVKQRILSQLSGHAELRKAAFAVVVKLWIDGNGRVSRVDLMDSTGKLELDNELRGELSRMSLEAPPPEAKMPVKLRIVARK